MIGETEIEKYLACVREIAKSHPIIDAHVHPFEVIYGGIRYQPDPHHPGLFTAGNSGYSEPLRGRWETSGSTNNSSIIDCNGPQARFAPFCMKRLYMHTGPKCLGDHMDLAGISKAILLPIFHPRDEDESQMYLLREMFGGDDRFIIGYCVPNFVKTENICRSIKGAIAEYGIRILKIHPNISAIDPGTCQGRRRIEAILAASCDCGLKVIIHGGSSPLLDCPERNYGSIHNLKKIEFGITDQPVVLAHGCTYGYETVEVEEFLPLLKDMLYRNENLMIDISATELEAICLMLKKIDHDRIVFGSDALYEFPWKTVVKLLHALKLTQKNYLEEFIKISSVNSLGLFRKEFEHDTATENKILSVH